MMGPPASGKTSIRYCFFKGLKPDAVLREPPNPTFKEEERFDHFDFLLRIIDLGGQESFLGEWTKGEKEKELFAAVDAIIYVVDAADPNHRNALKAVRILQRVASSTSKYSPQAKIHILLHKMDIVKTIDTATEFREKLMKAIATSTKEEQRRVAFYETSILDGTANSALRAIINEAMPTYGKIRELFEKTVTENRNVELIQLLAPRRPEMAGVKGQALVVAEAATSHNTVGGGVRVDFAPLIRRLNEAVGELGEGRVKYTLMMVETGRLIVLKDLGEYHLIIESRKDPDEKSFPIAVENVFTFVKDIERLTRPQNE